MINFQKIFNLQFPMGTTDSRGKNRDQTYDLAERTISQLIRSGTSIGLNYAEAINASSRKDFRNKIHITKKECHELTMIFQKIVSTMSRIKQERDIEN